MQTFGYHGKKRLKYVIMDDICCCCEKGSAMAMKVSFINEFMSKCAKEG